jgi:hypothetical protein
MSRSPEAVELIEEVGAASSSPVTSHGDGRRPGGDAERSAAFDPHVLRRRPGAGTWRGEDRLFKQLFALLDHLGYDGWVSAEYRPTKPTVETLAFLAAT